jgi:hypothetical protein
MSNNILTTYSIPTEIKGKMVKDWNSVGEITGCWQDFSATTYKLAFQMAENYANEVIDKLEKWLIKREDFLRAYEE